MEERAMSNMREQLLAKTAGIRATSSINEDEVKRSTRTQTAPGLAGALAVAQLRVQELESTGAASQLAVSDIVANPWQPRRVFNEAKLSELAESIREVGLMQPIVVRRSGDIYQIVAGERRWRSHKMIELATIKAVVVECSDADMAVLALVENVSRDDLSDYEVATSMRQTERSFLIGSEWPKRWVCLAAGSISFSRSRICRTLSGRTWISSHGYLVGLRLRRLLRRSRSMERAE